MRGTPGDDGGHHCIDRIIPARAGNARISQCFRGSDPDHPRACGERLVFSSLPSFGSGSSPRVRGTRFDRGVNRGCPRIIPVRAGNATQLTSSITSTLDHPRACGERCRLAQLVSVLPGSSQRVRGTLSSDRSRAASSRIIPARAGNAVVNGISRVWKADHPRACGERWIVESRERVHAGSSPRVRGTPAPYERTVSRIRIIPARAGNARIEALCAPAAADHPRACGERLHAEVSGFQDYGSSPRVRGTLGLRPRFLLGERIIPARAGNAAGHSRPGPMSPDHPRACGERTTAVDLSAV